MAKQQKPTSDQKEKKTSFIQKKKPSLFFFCSQEKKKGEQKKWGFVCLGKKEKKRVEEKTWGYDDQNIKTIMKVWWFDFLSQNNVFFGEKKIFHLHQPKAKGYIDFDFQNFVLSKRKKAPVLFPKKQISPILVKPKVFGLQKGIDACSP